MKIMRLKIKSFWMLCLLAGTSLFSSCEDFLDRQEDEKMTFDKIWLSRGTTQQYWLNAMSFLPDFNGGYIGDGEAYLGASDECTIAYDRGYRYMNFGSWNASSIPYYKYDYYYRGIRECNIFMQNVDRCSDPLVTKTELAKWKIQARWARAYYYFLLMRDFGPIFLVGDELLDFSATTEALYRPRNTWEQCVDYVVSEMNACAEDPAMMSQTALPKDEYGFATRGACYAIISRLTLYSARDLFNGNTLYHSVKNPVTEDFPDLSGQDLFPQTYDANKWLVAAKAAHKVFEENTYELYRAASNDPYENYAGVLNTTWNSELIYTDRYQSRVYLGINTAPTSIGAYGAVGPTQQQVDAYAMSNGRYPITGYDTAGNPIIDAASGYSGDEFTKTTWTYPTHGWSNVADHAIEAPNMYKDREPRFYVTVFWGDNEWIHGDAKTKTSFAKGGNGNTSHDYPKSGYLCNRFYDHRVNSRNSNWGNVTFPEFRLGEIYLNFIESVLECKKRGVTLPAGYEEEAMEKWAELRDRSGMDPITDIYPGATIDELIELYRKERRIELAFERHRFFDTRTWMIATQTDGGPMYGMNTAALLEDGMKATETPNTFWKRTVFETRVFKKNHFLYPFAQRELDRNRLLTQNYGW